MGSGRDLCALNYAAEAGPAPMFGQFAVLAINFAEWRAA
jgi:hypothetical protein